MFYNLHDSLSDASQMHVCTVEIVLILYENAKFTEIMVFLAELCVKYIGYLSHL